MTLETHNQNHNSDNDNDDDHQPIISCCSRGDEVSFTIRGRTGILELRLNGEIVKDGNNHQKKEEDYHILEKISERNSYEIYSQPALYHNIAIDYLTYPLNSMKQLTIDMDASLTSTSTSTTAPISLPRAIMYQFTTDDPEINMSFEAKEGFASRIPLLIKPNQVEESLKRLKIWFPSIILNSNSNSISRNVPTETKEIKEIINNGNTNSPILPKKQHNIDHSETNIAKTKNIECKNILKQNVNKKNVNQNDLNVCNNDVDNNNNNDDNDDDLNEYRRVNHVYSFENILEEMSNLPPSDYSSPSLSPFSSSSSSHHALSSLHRSEYHQYSNKTLERLSTSTSSSSLLQK
eukprot:CAMPEP_0114331800 /NCGR_PEP_ID=MMETSP0101-20121206/2659_1 /TAXON_ID=38822 ORGANISM="Pteridomonas danica, Strain PT" /NCGR_SAMPLE_ID=MMETSP0101 /ASSEMBLY_ACC=CAM_ASM_000211 /LENGTH=348 /DNA_ID=CAMNT_0001462265 /DNA_START=1217 /DNA_END=2260 /DNA_ORIENTATION=+